ncbi:MAG TPA: radical SAM protein [Candidatus Methanomethylophilaceae archaeon]|nr:radical SAM protein [Candidatus Methanomethylophilaceae archaeon]
MGVHKDKIISCSPGKGFPAVSVTGGRCNLMCEHCHGEHLKGMLFAETPSRLYLIAENVKSSGGSGILISGGSDRDGKVQLSDFVPIIREISNMGLYVNVHPGIINRDDAKLLVSSGVSCFSMDVHQDPEVIRNVFHLDGPEIYEDSIDAVLEAGGNIMPHLTVGFSHRNIVESASLVKRKELKEVVMLVLVPTKGTRFESNRVSEDEVVDSVKMLFEMGLNVTLGCMRDRRMRNIERICIEAGITKMANMSRETEEWATSQGYKVEKMERCCCFPLEQ